VPDGKANLSERQVPHLGGVISQAISPLEDPDEGVQATDRRVVLYQSNTKGEENCDCELCFIQVSLRKLHVHTIISILALHIYYMM